MRKIENIFSLLDSQGITAAEFERRNDLGNGYLKKTLENGADITQKMLERVRKSSPDFYNILMDVKAGNTPAIADYKEKYIQTLEEQKEDLRAEG
jgi:hypothetical protein